MSVAATGFAVPSLSSLSIRDWVALVVIVARASEPQTYATPVTFVADAFAIADAFLDQSTSRWAQHVREAKAATASPGPSAASTE